MTPASMNIPTILVILGATGDLMSKKIIPTLYQLHLKNKLPDRFSLIGYARRSMSDKDFRKHVIDSLAKHGIANLPKSTDPFLKLFTYHQGKFEQAADYTTLAQHLEKIDNDWKVCSNKLFYLSVPPKFYEIIFRHLASSGLTEPCGPEEGWTRVIVEKPFGKDLKTAQMLDALLAKYFKEEQIYRVDHYLAKEMLQNIMVFRFSNNMFEHEWNNKLIEKIEIRLMERIGVEDRGAFYDGVGALRDVGQNHLLQMLALMTMTSPASLDAASVRAKRAEILKILRIPDKKEIKNFTFRAQYEGYRGIKGVEPNSMTGT